VPFVLSLAMAATAAELPAARVGDSMQSGGVIARVRERPPCSLEERQQPGSVISRPTPA
jgi:hypothetical protein